MYLYYDISPQYSCTASIPKWIVIVKEKIVFSYVNLSFFISCKCCSVCFYFIWFMDSSSFHFAKDILSFYTYNTCITSPDFILWVFWLQFRMSSIVRISSTFLGHLSHSGDLFLWVGVRRRRSHLLLKNYWANLNQIWCV